MRDNPLRVCIVEDDDAVRDSLRLLLHAHGIAVQAFAAARPFLDAAAQINADCLVFDLHMPEMTGLELAEKVRAKQIVTPIIMVTGRMDRALARRLDRAGVSSVLAKPVRDGELLAAIRAAQPAKLSSSRQHV